MNHRALWMDADLELYRDMVRRFVANEIAQHQEKWSKQQQVDRELWNQAGALGVLLADVPDEYGGAGGNFAHMAILFEELSYAGATAFGAHAHACAAHAILNHGSDAQKRKYLPRLASGDMVATIAMLEPDAGSDLKRLGTSALKDRDGYRINGSKTFVSNGVLADLIVVAAKTDPDSGADGISLFLIETRDNPACRVVRLLEKIGQQGQDTCEIRFDDVRISTENLLGGVENHGLHQLMQEQPYERVLIGVSAAAAIERAVRLTVEYTRERKAFGKALIEMQNTRFKLAEAKTQATIARSLIDHCIARMCDGRMDPVTAALAKLWLSEAEGRVIDECLQLFGGYGYMLEYPIAQMYADARARRICGGTSETMKEIVADSL
ncbi:MAG: acyl-CoA dehydrogenase [Massilia sp.]|jgi:acyl-CoA dehydrogenase|nr:acyl-CoA dehydrogenase [Massilia sp.]MDB5952550.1 acyl-CoA dehydrogenase [Massilia sp.]